jgi:hypothetical protein
VVSAADGPATDHRNRAVHTGSRRRPLRRLRVTAEIMGSVEGTCKK